MRPTFSNEEWYRVLQESFANAVNALGEANALDDDDVDYDGIDDGDDNDDDDDDDDEHGDVEDGTLAGSIGAQIGRIANAAQFFVDRASGGHGNAAGSGGAADKAGYSEGGTPRGGVGAAAASDPQAKDEYQDQPRNPRGQFKPKDGSFSAKTKAPAPAPNLKAPPAPDEDK